MQISRTVSWTGCRVRLAETVSRLSGYVTVILTVLMDQMKVMSSVTVSLLLATII